MIRNIRMKGQTMEIFGIVILGVALIALLFYLGIFSMKGYSASVEELSQRQEDQNFKSGVDSILYTTDPKTGKTIQELLGIASKIGNTTVDFGPGAGSVDIKKELEWRFDAIYGKGNWYLRIPFPNVTADIQIVAVVDTSGSMCDQINTLAKDIPEVLERLRLKGKKAEMTMFLLGTPSCCVKDANGNWVNFHVSDIKQTDYFHVATMPQEYNGIRCKNACGADGSSDEDWGDGLVCAIEMGPYKGPGEYGWRDYVAKAAIPVSDELPGGIECDCPSGGAQKNFDAGLKKALEKSVYVFPFRGETCEPIHMDRDCSETRSLEPEYCTCSRGPLVEWMADLANQTQGQMYNLSDVVESSDTMEKLILGINTNRVPYLEAGTVIPKDKEIQAVTSLVPVTVLGKYVTLYVYHWNSN